MVEPFPNANRDGDDDHVILPQLSIRDLLVPDVELANDHDERIFRLCRMIGVRRVPTILLKAIVFDNEVRWENGRLDEGVYLKIKTAHLDVQTEEHLVWLIQQPKLGMIRLVARRDGLNNVVWKYSIDDSVGPRRSWILHPE